MPNSPTHPTVPILMYHQVSPRRVAAFGKYSVTPRAFALQMSWLQLAGYTAISVDTLLAARTAQYTGQQILPRRPVVITFDDGYADCVEYAVPILQAKGFTAIIYLVAGLMGQPSAWLAAERGVTFPLMDWSAARALAKAGIQCGAHTMHHPRLATVDAATCRAELQQARQVLEDQLGQAVHHLAYPYGSYNEGVRALAIETGYHSACSVKIGFSGADDDCFALHRVPISGHDTLVDFICRLRTAYACAEVWRGKVAGVRQRLGKRGAYST